MANALLGIGGFIMNQSFKRYFFKLFIPYIIVIAVVFSLSSIVYIIAFDEMQINALKMQESYIEQSKSVLDRRFTEAIDATYQIQELPKVRVFSNITNEEIEENYYPAIQLYNELDDLKIVNEIISGFYIFYKESKLVATPQEVRHYTTFSEEVFNLEGIDKDQLWVDLFSQRYTGEVFEARETLEVSNKSTLLPFVTTMGYDIKDPDAVIYMVLYADKLRANMTGFDSNFKGNFLINDEDGNVILSLNDQYGLTEEGTIDRKALSDDYVTISVESEVIPYSYTLVRHSDEVYKQLEILRNTTNRITFGILILGLLISLAFARYNTKPVATLVSNNQRLEERVSNQIPYLRTTFLERWLKGNYSNIDEIISITKFLKASYVGQFYCVFIVDYDEHIDILGEVNSITLGELEKKRIVVKDILLDHVVKAEYVHDIDHDKFAIIFIGDENDEEAFRAYVKEQVLSCKNVLDQHAIDDIHYGVGGIYEDMSMVSASLSNALDAISTSSNDEDGVILWYEDIEEITDGYYYPFDVEVRLFNQVRSGEIEQVSQILRDVLKKNIVDRTLPTQVLKAFIYELWGTLAKVRERAVGEDSEVNQIISEAFDRLDELSDLEKVQYCKKTIIKATEVFEVKRSKRSNQELHSINTYIQENFKDPYFSLSQVADEYKISSTYLSQKFKDFNGESFINYLQKLRMKEAEHLLKETDMSVKQIVIESGYNSSNTFGKAFKRMHGVTASEYRIKQR